MEWLILSIMALLVINVFIGPYLPKPDRPMGSVGTDHNDGVCDVDGDGD